MKRIFALSAIAATLLLVSCGGETNDETTTTTTTETDAPTSMVADPAANPNITVNGNTVEVNLEGSDDMKYNLNEIRVKAGQTVKITLKNVGKLPKESMGHNVVVLKPGTDVAAYATKAMEAKATDYYPASEASSVIAHSKMLGPGESDVVEFAAPAAGTYDYICSFPGHYASMRGVLIVE